MDLIKQWPVLGVLRQIVRRHSQQQLWLFGSALYSMNPSDLDVIVIYADRQDLTELKAAILNSDWSMPPVDLTAMTGEEEAYYNFIEATGAKRLV